MKTVCKKLLSLTLVAMMLVSAVPFQAFASEVETTAALTETTAAVAETEAVAAAVETTAATEAVETTAATEATETAPATLPAVPVTEPIVTAVGDYVNVVFTLKDYPQANSLTLYTQKIGYKTTSIPDANKVLEVFAQYAGNSINKVFSHWEVNGAKFNPSTTNITDSIVAAGDTLYIYAVVTNQSYTVGLEPAGGVLADRKHTIVLNDTYGAVESLPTPTRQHYDFAGWSRYYDGKIVTDSSIVVDDSHLVAKWVLTKYNVTFQRYDGNGWVNVDSSICGGTVTALSTISSANAFPTQDEINAYFGLNGFKIVGWEIGETDKAFTAGSTQITGDMVIRPRYQGAVTLMANNPNDYTSNSVTTMTVEIGEPIGKMPNAGARNGYTFVDWVGQDQVTVISTKDNLSNTATHPDYYPAIHGTTFYARWAESVVVYLYIHTNGNTQTATKIVPYYEAPAAGAFNMNTVNMYSIFPNYGDFDDNVDTYYGWFSKSEWKNYSAGTASNYANNVFYNVGSNADYQELHIMLINNGKGTSSGNVPNNNYNNNVNTADPSNPTTGDNIMIAVTVMALSASALALAFFLKKRKAA